MRSRTIRMCSASGTRPRLTRLSQSRMSHAMGHPHHYRPADFTDEEVEALCSQMIEAAGRMADDQVLMLADALHDLLRRRRGSRAFQRPDPRH